MMGRLGEYWVLGFVSTIFMSIVGLIAISENAVEKGFGWYIGFVFMITPTIYWAIRARDAEKGKNTDLTFWIK